jgi:hypothetical protein
MTLAHEVEALWQSVIDELENAQQRIHKSANTHPAVQSILVALSDWEDTFRKAKALAGKIANDCDKGFDGWSAKNAADVLRACISSKIQLEHDREKMRLKLLQIGTDLQNPKKG